MKSSTSKSKYKTLSISYLFRNHKYNLLIGIISLSMLFGGIYFYNNLNRYSFDISGEVFDLDNNSANIPKNIVIPAVGISVAVKPAIIENDQWGTYDNDASYLLGSGVPGESGNIVIYGHNNYSVFNNLKSVKVGDEIYLTDTGNHMFTYNVERKIVTDPSDVGYILESVEPIITVYTCYGFLDKDRLIIQAKLINSAN